MQIDKLREITFGNVFRVSLPLMISSLSSHFMLIFDQLVLARYSIDAMVGASSASVWCAAIQCAAMSTVMIVASFVGNYNGAGKYSLAGVPVWQMIWFSLSLFVISIPLSLWGADVCIPDAVKSEGVPYFKLLMFFTPLYGVYYSLSSFFVAIGKGYLVTFSVVFANIANIALDIILVFGLWGFDHFKGSAGAAVGTIAVIFFNVIFLSFWFFSKKVREKYHTLNFKLRISKLKECLRLGLAGGLGHIFEMLSWSVVYQLLASVSKELAMVQSIAVSVNIFLTFIVSGLEKGVMAFTANLLGAGLRNKVGLVLKKAVGIHFAFTFIVGLVFLFAPNFVLDNFIRFDVSPGIIQKANLVLYLVLFYYFWDGIVWLIAGVLEAGGDINYTMLTIATCLWAFVAIPDCILYKFGYLRVELTWVLLIIAVVSIVLVLYHRYRSDRWIHIKV